jgi:hypothetical protein
VEVIVDAEQRLDFIIRLAVGAHFLAHPVVFDRFPRRCMCGKKLNSVASLGSVPRASTR